MQRYLAVGWTSPDGAVTLPSPLSTKDRPCRSVNVVLVTDGDETCDTQRDAVAAAAQLYQIGVTVGGNSFKVRTFVVNLAGGTSASADQIAAAGGTDASYLVTDEAQLSAAFATIVARTAPAETCDNADNNCNGCTNEGFRHYCNVRPAPGVCCPWGTTAQRTACLSSYAASISSANPQGDQTKLPCTTAAQQTQPPLWLCADPGDACDSVDNNCQDGVDEGVTRCGNPAHCPGVEVCNGLDDDCYGLVDDSPGCPPCVPTPEVCDGCDNDCDGVADNGISPAPCGQPSPPNCAGSLVCKPPQPVTQPGACVAGGGYGVCTNSPRAETCDGLDDDCDGIVDDGIAPTPCVPPGTPAGRARSRAGSRG